MSAYLLMAAVLFPMGAGILLYLTRGRSWRTVQLWTAAVTVLTSLLVWALILLCEEQGVTLLRFSPELSLFFRLDGLGRFFAGIVATLWPLTVLYAFSYMEHEENRGTFFAFFTMSYGATLGVAMAGNLFTMYFFYELLTLFTVPLVMHTLEKKAVRATRTYLFFSMGGAAFAFVSMAFLVVNGLGDQFVLGGYLHAHPQEKEWLSQLFYLMGFFGFGVKAAVFPTHFWLPKASVAPTPVTALLHAVAVVKSGVFAIVRLTYFSFGTELLVGGWGQRVAMCFAIFTLFYGAVKAVKERHFKRRLAYSTVANLSYILFGVTMMSEAGLAAGLLHMAFHAEIKILAFFCAGAVLHTSGREWLRELDGLGRRMPVTLGAFTVSALALAGVPPLSGFVSKWSLLTAAAESGDGLAYAGAGVLLGAALLTAVYMFIPVRRMWFPAKTADLSGLADVHEADWRMTVPMVLLAAGILLTGMFAGTIVDAAAAIAAGLS